MLYNISYTWMDNTHTTPPYIEEQKDCDSFQEAITYAFERALAKAFEYKWRDGNLDDYLRTYANDPYLLEHNASPDLIQAIAMKRYAIDTAKNLWFYAVPVECDEVIQEAIDNGVI